MEKKKKLFLLGIILFSVFFLVIGGSYAYFSVIFKDTRSDDSGQGNTDITTGKLSNTTIISNIPKGVGSFLNTNIYPGHKEVLGLSVTGSGDKDSKSYFQFKYEVEENGLGQNVKVSVYSNNTPIEITENYFECVKKNEKIEGSNDTKYFETCAEKELGNLIQETTLNGVSEDLVIGKDIITIKEDNVDVIKYYYVVVEFVNKDESQNEDMNLSLVGKVTVELTTPFEIEEPSFANAVIECGKKGMDTATCMLNNSDKDKVNLVYDGTTDNNLRYIGANPNNYVYFNCDDYDNPTSTTCEKWRIIGLMNHIKTNESDTTGETRIKIIRNESIGTFSWDTSASNVNDGLGVNEWSQADLMKLLNPNYATNQDLESSGNTITVNNSLYWNKQRGTCYNGQNNATATCDFTNTGLKNEATRNMILEAVWNTGSNGTEIRHDNILASKFYELERSSNTGKICTSGTYCNDNVTRTTTWTGRVGLMYPSDYGYATTGGSTTNRETCLNTVLYNWNNLSISDCKTNDWLYKSGTYPWTISPIAHSSYASLVFFVHSPGSVSNTNGRSTSDVLPTLFLNSKVKIIDGEGSETSPFILREG